VFFFFKQKTAYEMLQDIRDMEQRMDMDNEESVQRVLDAREVLKTRLARWAETSVSHMEQLEQNDRILKALNDFLREEGKRPMSVTEKAMEKLRARSAKPEKRSKEQQEKVNEERAKHGLKPLDLGLHGEAGKGARTVAAALTASGVLGGTRLEDELGAKDASALREVAALGKLSAQSEALEAWQAEYLARLAIMKPHPEEALAEALDAVSGEDKDMRGRLAMRAEAALYSSMDEMDEWIYRYGVPPQVAASELALKAAHPEMLAARTLYG